LFRETAGVSEITEKIKENSTISDLIDNLANKFGGDFREILDPKTGEINLDTLILLNGQSLRKTETVLKENDSIAIAVPIAGG
jgi:molybdopterin converting factor small subunit